MFAYLSRQSTCCGEVGISAKMGDVFLRHVQLCGGHELTGKTGHLASHDWTVLFLFKVLNLQGKLGIWPLT